MDRIFARAASLVLLAASSSSARAAQYTAVDLYPLLAPAGLSEPEALSAFAGQVVGNAYDRSDPDAYPTPPPHAVLWNQAGSAVDLTLNGFNATGVSSTDGIHQFGSATTATYNSTPVVWSGSAASATFLSKQGFASAGLAGGGGGQFVGSGEVHTLDGSPHALVWNSLTANPIDLNPTNLIGSYAFGASGTQQVGHGFGPNFEHALLWTGSAASAVDLHPTNLPGITNSIAVATDGRQQVGNGGPNGAYGHALLWSGTANSAVNLTPPGFYSSSAYGVRNGKQVGDGQPTYLDLHAMLWSGTAASAIDLHLLLPNSFGSSTAYSIDDAGNVFGVGFNWADQQYHAVKWVPVAGPSGDFNSDGKVDAADYVLWRKSNGSQSGYDTWRSHFGQSAGSGAALPSAEPLSAAVPEPATVILCCIGLVALSGDMVLARRRVRQSIRSQTRIAREARRWTVHNWLLNLGAKLVLILLTLLSTSRASHAGLSFLPWDLSSEPPEVQWATYPLMADFTSDGILDKISSNLHEVVVRPGRGDGTFGDPIRSAIHPAWGAPALAVADFSNDGRLDVFTFDWDYHDNYGIANVVLGNGNGRFSMWETLEFGTDYSGGLGTGDINRDGLTDVAIAAGHDPDTGEPYLTALFNDGNWPSVEPALPGDYNRNGTVDAADYVVWRKNNGTTNALPNDPAGGTIGTAQYNTWRTQFGKSAGSGSGASANTVPEPATFVLTILAAAGVACHSRLREKSQKLLDA